MVGTCPCMAKWECHYSSRGSQYPHYTVQNGRWRCQHFCMCLAKGNDQGKTVNLDRVHHSGWRKLLVHKWWQIVKRLILKKGHYTSVADFKKDLKQAGGRKQLLNFIKSGTVEQTKTRDPNAMDINAAWSSNSKCSTVADFAKEYKKPILQCSECKFLDGRHKKDCFCHRKGSRQAWGSKKEEEAITSWDEDKSTKKEKEDKGKGHYWFKSIHRMNFDEAHTWFKDYENITSKVLWSHSPGLLFNKLVNFSPLWSYLILSLQTLNCEEVSYRNSPISHSFQIHNTCLPHGKSYSIKPNFILDSSLPCCAWLCCHTHVPSSCYDSLPFCHHHMVASCLSSPLCLS